MSNKFNKYLVLTLFFITRYVYAGSNPLNEITATTGGIAFKPDDSTIYFKQGEGISNDFSNADLGSIHYTIAKFYRVSGLSTQLKGVSPDIAFPPLVDDSEFGERSEPNALAWDKIAPSDYKGFLNIDAYVNDLTRMHEERIKDDVAFKIMKEDMDRYLKLKAEKTLSVNLAERRKMQQEDEKYRLNAVNERLKSIGKKPIKDIKDLPEDFEFPDALLDEAAAIANDFASLVDQKRYLARTTPIFTRFSVASVAEEHKASSGTDRQ